MKIDKFYPSSKRCYDCSYIMPKIPLHIRKWTCPNYGQTHDHDINAARNILVDG